MNAHQQNTLSDLHSTYKGFSKWEYREEPTICAYVTVCAYSSLGHCWSLWIIGKHGALANDGRAVLIPGKVAN
jgi:hypothetical protein